MTKTDPILTFIGSDQVVRIFDAQNFLIIWKEPEISGVPVECNSETCKSWNLCNSYGSLVCVLNFRSLRFDSGESLHTRNSQEWFNFEELLFGIKQLKQNRIGKSILQNQCFSFKFGITKDRIFYFIRENQKKTSGYPHVVVKWGT